MLLKRHWKSLFISFTILSLFSLSVHSADTYTLDPDHTYVLWHANHFGFSNPSGKWMAQGTLTLDQAKPQSDQVNATITVANGVTGIPKLDEHLQGPLFFDTAQYPTATFVSNQVTVTGPKAAKVSGILTLRGVSRPVTLNVTFNKAGVNPVNNKQTVGFSATTQFKRSEFGMTTLIPGVSDEVKINIEAEAYKANTA